MWTPSVGTRCGVAQYADALVTAMHRLGLPVTHSAEPDEGARLMHLQHEHSLVAPERVSDVARYAREADVPFVVTEHAVRGQADVWEGEAAALVAHSTEGVALLSDRQPGRRVELIPHGCPTWFPQRKVHRDRVVATFNTRRKSVTASSNDGKTANSSGLFT